ncbi:MAG: DNA polymerase III subunit delta [Candidatus Fraserbacteria bacterium RBG_16_55_9]|uniref:DNA-directed DNA polymerase n=1 Tax=Fraserbacteria sp. (strain RBG_16_55_9) TaxID=1817864 RepID=A0A1F5US45_FRAXR|nr:MAG: DNA polymerase III subunit delta [Candidatus Fraserbacteria bacterium RBG_16_55_9]
MSVHLFTGEEWSRKRGITQLKRDLRTRIRMPWMETQLDGEEFPMERFVEALETSPLFREGVILHIKRVEKLSDPNSLAERLKHPLPPEQCVIFEGEKLEKRGKLYQTIAELGQVHEHPRLDRRTLPTLANDLLRERGVRLPPQGLRYLLESVESNPFRLEYEIEKLSIYATRQELSLVDLRELLFHDRGGDLFACLDALVERQPEALRFLKELLESGEEPSKVFYLLASQIRAILMIQSLHTAGCSREEISGRTGDYPWRVAKRLQTAKRLTCEELIRLIHALHREDLGIKRGERQPEEALWALALEWSFPSDS